MDFLILQFFNQFALKWFWLDILAIFFAKYLGYILIFCLIFFLLKNFKKYWPMVLIAFFSVLLARGIIVELIRFFWKRPRPFLENNVKLILNHSLEPSFPSGHAAFYFALATIIYSYNKKSGLLFF